MKIHRSDSAYDCDLRIYQEQLTIVTRETSDAVILFSESRFDEDEENLIWVVENSKLSEAVRVFFVPSRDEADIVIAQGQSKYDIQWVNKDKQAVLKEAMKKAQKRFDEMMNPK